MAQIMRFHRWPEQGFGSCEMDAKQGLISVHEVREYYNHHYDWGIMPLNKKEYTEEGAYEVSKLMMDIAVALRTTFSGSSSATHITIVPMMLSYFNYDPSIKEVTLKDMSTESFNSIVIADLQAGRPVYFQGTPSSGGHAFVCDGYNGAGLFHINWGWSGTADGYFRITNLSPSEAGTGGVVNAGYSTNLMMIHNIKPFKNGILARPEIKANYVREMQTGIKVEKTNNGCRFGGTFRVYPAEPQYRNIRTRMGLCIEKPDGTRIEKWSQNYTQILRANYDDNLGIDVESSLLTEGNKVYYIHRERDNEDWQYVRNTRGDCCTFSIARNEQGDLLAKTDDIAYVIEKAGTGTSSGTVDITYELFLDGTSIGQTTVAEVVGSAPSKAFVPEYYVRAEGFPEVVPAEPTTYTIHTYYKDTMPFETGSTPYNINFSLGGNTYMWYVNSNTALEQKNPDPSTGNNQNAKWRFSGNWFEGFSIQNLNGAYLTTPFGAENEQAIIPNSNTAYSARQSSSCFIGMKASTSRSRTVIMNSTLPTHNL